MHCKRPLTSRGHVHPGESDSSDDTFAEAQQERASLLLLQEGFLFAFAHKPHDQATDGAQVKQKWIND